MRFAHRNLGIRRQRWDVQASDKLDHLTVKWMKHHSVTDIMDTAYDLYQSGENVDALVHLFRDFVDMECFIHESNYHLPHRRHLLRRMADN